MEVEVFRFLDKLAQRQLVQRAELVQLYEKALPKVTFDTASHDSGDGEVLGGFKQAWLWLGYGHDTVLDSQRADR